MNKIFKKKKTIPPLYLAPMVGITDLPFRLVCKDLGADKVYSEMVSVDALFYESEKTRDLLKIRESERPVIVQIFGKEPKLFYKAAQYISSLPPEEQPDGIDINFGCPAKKVTNNGGGVKLMLKPKLAHEIIAATILGASKLPVSIKIRAGIKDMTAENFLKQVSDLDWRSVIIHGRTYEQGFAGKANWAFIKKIKKQYKDREVVVNGSIYTPEDAKQAWKESGADAIALAQGVLGRPWLFAQIKDYFINGDYNTLAVRDVKKIVQYHLQLLLEIKGEYYLKEFRKHLAWYFKGIPGAAQLRSKLVRVDSIAEVNEILYEIDDDILI